MEKFDLMWIKKYSKKAEFDESLNIKVCHTLNLNVCYLILLADRKSAVCPFLLPNIKDHRASDVCGSFWWKSADACSLWNGEVVSNNDKQTDHWPDTTEPGMSHRRFSQAWYREFLDVYQNGLKVSYCNGKVGKYTGILYISCEGKYCSAVTILYNEKYKIILLVSSWSWLICMLSVLFYLWTGDMHMQIVYVLVLICEMF